MLLAYRDLVRRGSARRDSAYRDLSHTNLQARDRRIGTIIRKSRGFNGMFQPELALGITKLGQGYEVGLPYGDTPPDLEDLGFPDELRMRVSFILGQNPPGSEHTNGGQSRILSPAEWEGLKARLPAAFARLHQWDIHADECNLGPLGLHPGDRLAVVMSPDGTYELLEDLIVEEFIEWTKATGAFAWLHRPFMSSEKVPARRFRFQHSIYDPNLPPFEESFDPTKPVAWNTARYLNNYPAPLPKPVRDALYLGKEYVVDEMPLPVDKLLELSPGEHHVVLLHPEHVALGPYYPYHSRESWKHPMTVGRFEGADSDTRTLRFLPPWRQFDHDLVARAGLPPLRRLSYHITAENHGGIWVAYDYEIPFKLIDGKLHGLDRNVNLNPVVTAVHLIRMKN